MIKKNNNNNQQKQISSCLETGAEEGWTRKWHEKLLGVMEVFCRGVFTGHICLLEFQIVHFKWMHSIVRKLDLHKVDF